jgi:transposase
MTYYLGIDLHKRTSTWVLLDEDRSLVKKSVHPCATYEHIARAIHDVPVPLADIKVALEPVCGWRWTADMLTHAGMDVSCANTLKTRLIASSKLKHDTVDAIALAELLRADFLPKSYQAPPDIVALRDLVRERAYLVHMRTGLKNRLQGIVTARGSILPLSSVMKKEGAYWIREHGDDDMRRMVSLIEMITKEIRTLDERVECVARTHPVPQLLMTMPAVGPVTAVTVFAEVGDFTRFSSPNKLTAYAGLVPSERSSAGRIAHGHITKLGSPYLRGACVEAAMRIRETTDPVLYGHYLQLKPRAGAMKTRVALARKMLTIMWYMVNRHEPYRMSTHTAKLGDLERPF